MFSDVFVNSPPTVPLQIFVSFIVVIFVSFLDSKFATSAFFELILILSAVNLPVSVTVTSPVDVISALPATFNVPVTSVLPTVETVVSPVSGLVRVVPDLFISLPPTVPSLIFVSLTVLISVSFVDVSFLISAF